MTRTEVLVIGAGPAGIAAATAASENGSKVVLLDDNAAPGGQIWRSATVQENGASKWRSNETKRRELERLWRSGAEVLSARSVFDVDASGTLQALHEAGSSSLVDQF